MVSIRIQDLDTEDLNYLERLLGREFARLNEESMQWKAAHGYERPNTEAKRALKLMNAISSQKRLTTIAKW